jgi:hypothetical protein
MTKILAKTILLRKRRGHSRLTDQKRVNNEDTIINGFSDLGLVRFICSLVLLFTFFLLCPTYANQVMNINGIYYMSSGKYHVEENENGTILLTDNAGAWILDGDDLNAFKSGDNGIYYTEIDTDTPYILTDKNRRFYITNKELLDKLTQTKKGISAPPKIEPQAATETLTKRQQSRSQYGPMPQARTAEQPQSRLDARTHREITEELRKSIEEKMAQEEREVGEDCGFDGVTDRIRRAVNKQKYWDQKVNDLNTNIEQCEAILGSLYLDIKELRNKEYRKIRIRRAILNEKAYGSGDPEEALQQEIDNIKEDFEATVIMFNIEQEHLNWLNRCKKKAQREKAILE